MPKSPSRPPAEEPGVAATLLVEPGRARTRRHPWRTLGLILGGAFLVAAAIGVLLRRLDAPAGPPLVLGLAPRFTDEQAAELRPFLDHIGRRIGRRIEARPMRDYESLRSGLLLGKLQLASLPHLQLLLTRREGRQLSCLATETFEGSPTYTSVFVARDNSRIAALADLRGKRFCYVDAGSASGFLIPRLFLRDRGLDPDRLFSGTRYSNGAFAALGDVVEGRCDASAVGASNLFLAAQQGVATSRLRTVLTAGQIPLDTICASPALPAALFGELRRALLAFRAQRDIRRNVLGPSFIVDGFTDPRWADFDVVERAARAEKIIP